MLVDVIRVEVLEPYRLRLAFDDGSEGAVDIAEFGPFDGVFAELKVPSVFAQFRVDPELRTIVWPGGADIDPDVLHAKAHGRPIDFGPKPIQGAARDSGSRNPNRASVRARERLSCVGPRRDRPRGAFGMPEICRFLGIVITMYHNDHVPPHFHAWYGGRSASIRLAPLALLDGSVPPRVLGLVMEWAKLHEAELREDWDRASLGEELRRIAPLE